jgi:arylsulfatase A-like enzyme
LYQEQVHVPLLFYNSGLFSGGRKITDKVQLIDVYPTLLEFIGLKPDSGIQGHSLIPGLRSNQFPVRPVLSEIDIDSHPRFAAFKRSQRMILEDSLKYIDSSNRANHLFDLQTDPAEMFNQQNSEKAEQLQKKLNELFRALEILKHKGSGKLDEETREKLKALGYIE